MTHIRFCDVKEDWQRAYLEDGLDDLDTSVETTFHGASLQEVPEPDLESTQILSVFIDSDCGREQLEKLPDLQFVTTRSTGFDHVDLDVCRERDIPVSNVPTYGEHTVAEHTFALLLNLSRRVHEVVQSTPPGDFEFGGTRGFDLRGKTMGLIGTGHIGKHVAKMARGFGMDVVAHDVDEDPFIAELLNYRYVSLDDLLESADIISLHLPLNDHTHHILGADELKRCKDDAIIINTARGGLIDTNALLRELENDHLGGAGLDVIEGEEMILSEPELNEKEFSREKLEQLVENSRLLKRDDVIFTPHMAYNSREAIERILDTTIGNIRSYLDGQPTNTVN